MQSVVSRSPDTHCSALRQLDKTNCAPMVCCQNYYPFVRHEAPSGKIRTDAAECALISDLVTAPQKRELFARLAEHHRMPAAVVERAIAEKASEGDQSVEPLPKFAACSRLLAPHFLPQKPATDRRRSVNLQARYARWWDYKLLHLRLLSPNAKPRHCVLPR
jgi:hypothetical protein